jgi:hypothetical protein
VPRPYRCERQLPSRSLNCHGPGWKINQEPIIAQEAGTNQDLIAVNKGRLYPKHLAVKREIDKEHSSSIR